ncbi:hypothetical protein F4780DRAFT_621513 [Xylariomycetidae sp. FL0641]|nr:hypothetical protein F4780DRAFT_621513 [Xylariomycetidae sp. FL0641]
MKTSTLLATLAAATGISATEPPTQAQRDLTSSSSSSSSAIPQISSALTTLDASVQAFSGSDTTQLTADTDALVRSIADEGAVQEEEGGGGVTYSYSTVYETTTVMPAECAAAPTGAPALSYSTSVVYVTTTVQPDNCAAPTTAGVPAALESNVPAAPTTTTPAGLAGNGTAPTTSPFVTVPLGAAAANRVGSVGLLAGLAAALLL